MIKTEVVTINGVECVHTYSDAGYELERDGIRYADAIDPIDSGRVYTEIVIEDDSEATEADYQEALREMGVEV